MSGDGQIDAHDIVAGYKKILDTGADIIKPRRIKREDGLFRAIQSFVYNTLLKTLFGLPLWDFNCPAKMIRRDFLKRLNIQSKDWFIDPEMIIKIKYLGGKIEEIPVTYRKRVRGVGHVNLSSAWEVFSNIIRWRIHYRELVVNGVSRARSQ
ncbi:MAG: hypothetical protein A3B99_04855 [Candidatus Yanofskybacteria bacterium RIFCSPHIGHO2_02_FULL_44_12b]|nr:MAG: hypothetical protein A3B99_04855 [Candidatus Yanofskybacteria bacterium RIFCSPHIGHO2_02_FULL_44_12b]